MNYNYFLTHAVQSSVSTFTLHKCCCIFTVCTDTKMGRLWILLIFLRGAHSTQKMDGRRILWDSDIICSIFCSNLREICYLQKKPQLKPAQADLVVFSGLRAQTSPSQPDLMAIRTYFTRWQIRRNSYKGPHLTPPLNLTFKSYKWCRTHSYELVTS